MIIFDFFYLAMQTRVDWTTGGISFYDVDPPKVEDKLAFKAEDDINSQFDPVPSQYSSS